MYLHLQPTHHPSTRRGLQGKNKTVRPRGSLDTRMDIHTNEIFENPDQAMDVVSSDEEEEKSSDKDVLMQQQQQQQQAEEEEDNDAPCRCLSFHSNNILSSNTSDRLIAISDDESVYSSSNLDKDNSHTFTHSRPAAQFLKSDQFPAEP